MADAGRKDFSTKASEALTPDSSKSTQEKMKETVTDAGDKMARGAQTDDSKSTSQSLADKAGRSKDEQQHGGSTGSVLDKAKDALGMNK